MSLQYRRSKSLGGGARFNVSASGRGPRMSVSQRVGPLTLNSRGRGSLRIAPGLSMRFGKRNGSGAGALIVLTLLAIEAFLVLLRVAIVVMVWLLRWVAIGTQEVAIQLRERRARKRFDEHTI